MLAEHLQQALGLFRLTPLYGGGFWVAYAQLVAFYYAAGLLLHFVLPSMFTFKSVQPHQRKPWTVQRDAFYSLGPLAVKAGVWTFVEWLHKNNLGLLYTGPVKGSMHVAYMVAAVVVLDYLHDAWFYATHRLLHWSPLYRHVHYIHHKSTTPSAFTGYSFHVVEAAIVFANEVLVCFLMPLHMGLHRWYHILTTIIHEGGHVGYELAPFVPTLVGMATLAVRGTAKLPAKGLNTVLHHDMHHRYPNRHFSLYFTHLDRMCGTLHPRYDEEVQHLFQGDGAGDNKGLAKEGEGLAEKVNGRGSGHSSRASSEGAASGSAAHEGLGASPNPSPAKTPRRTRQQHGVEAEEVASVGVMTRSKARRAQGVA